MAPYYVLLGLIITAIFEGASAASSAADSYPSDTKFGGANRGGGYKSVR